MGSLLGLDWGQKRVGVAFCDSQTTIATGVTTLEFKSRQQLVSDLLKLVKEYQVTKIVIGLPKTLKGEMGPAAQKMTEQVEWLKTEIPVPLEFWDERLSTAEVERILLAADVSRAKRKEVRDQLAAQRILQNYIDYHRTQ